MRIRLNQEYRNKIATRMRVHLEVVSSVHATEKTSLSLACSLVPSVLAYDLRFCFGTLGLVLV